MKKMFLNNIGFCLLEVLVSVAVFSIGSLALARVVAANQHFNRLNDERSGAVFAAGQVLDELRMSPTRSMPASGADPARAVMVGTRAYDVHVNYCQDGTYCTSESVRVVRVEVKLNGKTRYTLDTVFAELK